MWGCFHGRVVLGHCNKRTLTLAPTMFPRLQHSRAGAVHKSGRDLDTSETVRDGIQLSERR